MRPVVIKLFPFGRANLLAQFLARHSITDLRSSVIQEPIRLLALQSFRFAL